MSLCFRRALADLLNFSCCVALAASLCGQAGNVSAEPVVPGTGQRVVQVGDDFEEEDWEFFPNGAKSSEEQDGYQRLPAGESKNDRWYEGVKRGYPDLLRRVETPPGGLPGSTGALLIRSMNTGIPGRPSYRQQQDDFICNVSYKLGGAIPVWQTPSVVTRVFLPPVAQWEKRNGCHFAFRAALDSSPVSKSSGRFQSASSTERETYWPGLLVQFESKAVTGKESDYAYFTVRANSSGHDFRGPQITQTGWWTLGMSFTPDGQVHYYAKPGIEDLTKDDYITSQYPYSFRCERFRTFFFNSCSGDDGRTWSTPVIVDDSFVYYITK
jgi:hypothetical protein